MTSESEASINALNRTSAPPNSNPAMAAEAGVIWPPESSEKASNVAFNGTMAHQAGGDAVFEHSFSRATIKSIAAFIQIIQKKKSYHSVTKREMRGKLNKYTEQ